MFVARGWSRDLIGVGIIGYGYWGPNLLRNFFALEDCHVVGVCDGDSARLSKVSLNYPTVEVFTKSEDLINHPGVDAVVIATPVDTHFDLSLSALQSGKHVLVEKPIAGSTAEAKVLIEEADKRRKVLMVGHTFLYTQAVRKLKEEVDKQEFGDLLYYDSTRVSFGPVRSDVNVLWDLAVHDLSILGHILNAPPREVSATGRSSVPDRPEATAYLTVYFDNAIAHVNANWLSPVKTRRTVVGGSKSMIVYDDLQPIEKIKVYDMSVSLGSKPDELHKQLVQYRIGDMSSPRVPETEALATEAQHFLDCIGRGTQQISDGEQGLTVVSILEAANRSLRERGHPQTVPRP